MSKQDQAPPTPRQSGRLSVRRISDLDAATSTLQSLLILAVIGCWLAGVWLIVDWLLWSGDWFVWATAVLVLTGLAGLVCAAAWWSRLQRVYRAILFGQPIGGTVSRAELTRKLGSGGMIIEVQSEADTFRYLFEQALLARHPHLAAIQTGQAVHIVRLGRRGLVLEFYLVDAPSRKTDAAVAPGEDVTATSDKHP